MNGCVPWRQALSKAVADHAKGMRTNILGVGRIHNSVRQTSAGFLVGHLLFFLFPLPSRCQGAGSGNDFITQGPFPRRDLIVARKGWLVFGICSSLTG